MRRFQSDNYKKLMPLKRIAEASSYSFGYISILVQRKKLKAKKIGNKYYSTQEWFDQYLELHARDGKRLAPEAVRELSSGETSEFKLVSESRASAKLKSQIDNLVERSIKEKFAAQAKQEKKQESRNWIADQVRNDDAGVVNVDETVVVSAGEVLSEKEKIVTRQPEIAKFIPSDSEGPAFLSEARNDNTAPEKNLAEILNNKIASPEAKFIADFVEPEERLKIKWQESLRQEAKDLSKRQSAAASKIKTEVKRKARAASKQKGKVIILAAALSAANIFSLFKEFFSAGKNNLLSFSRRLANVSLKKAQGIKAVPVRLIKTPAALLRAIGAKAHRMAEKPTSLGKAFKSLAGGVGFFVARLFRAAAKIKSPLPPLLKGADRLTFKPWVFKTAAATLAVALVIIYLNHFAPGATADFSQKFGRAFVSASSKIDPVKSQLKIGALSAFNGIKGLAERGLKSKYLAQVGEPIEKVKKLPASPNVIIPGSTLAARAKTSVDNLLLNLADSLNSAGLKLENNFRRRNQILAARLSALKGQTLFIAGFWSGQYQDNISQPLRLAANEFSGLKPALIILPAKTVRLGASSLAALKGFLNFQGQSMGEVVRLAKDKSPLPPFVKGGKSPLVGVGEKRGIVAGAFEEASPVQPFSRLLSLANTTSLRGQEVLNQVKYNASAVLENSADGQRRLSLSLGRKLAKFTLAGAKSLGLVSQNGQNKLAQLTDTISQTNNSIQQTGESIQAYNNSGRKYLAEETGRLLWSLGDVYSKIIDRLIPGRLKIKYARLYEQPQIVVEKQTMAVKQGAPAVALTAPVKSPLPPLAKENNLKSPHPPLLKGAELSITGNADIGGELNVSGPVKLKSKLAVLGQSEFLGDVTVNAALTAKTLLVTDYAQFAGAINAKDITADNLTSRGSLTVVGGSFIGGNELISGNLKVSGTFQAGHTEFSSLGVTGSLGAQSLSAGSGGLVVSGNAYLNGDSNLISGNVALNNILAINKNSGSALTVGDGSSNTFTVDTHNDIVTIAATLNLTGHTQFNGDLDLNGALDLDTASTSALTIGNGVNDNFKVDTVNGIITLGYSSTTDQINVNAKQVAMNFASSTAGLLINYDGTGNIIQVVDNGVNRFILADNGSIIQTASTTGYAYVLNQAGTNGNLLDAQDQGVSRFTISDLGITNLIASSTAGTALTIRQNDTGDILNLFDGNAEILTVLDGGNVGIGTTTPYATLSVAGRAVFNQDIRLDYFTATSTSATSTIAGGLAIETNGLVYDWQTNNIGINTASPAYKLDVNGALRAAGISYFDSNIYLGDATTSDITYFNSRIGDHLVPTADNVSDLGDGTNWLRWRTGYFGTSVGIGGLATSTGADLLANGAYLIDAKSTLSINTTNNQPVIFGSGKATIPYASSTALTVLGTASTTDMYVSGNQYLSQMISGSILFAGASGLISQNNANLNWDNTANLLTVLGNATTTQLTTTGSTYLATAGGNVGIGTTTPWGLLSVNANGITAGAPQFVVGSSTRTDLVVMQSGNIGIGTTSPGSALSVTGNGYFTGDLIAGGTAGLTLIGAGSDITFYGSDNHDITAAEGTLRIGSNTFIGNIEALDNTIDIGTGLVRFDKIYANEVNATTLVGTLTAGNLVAETFTINSDNNSNDEENSYLAFERGSVTPNAALYWDAGNKRFDFNQPLYIQTASSTNATSTLLVQGLDGQTGDIFRVASSSNSLAAFFNVTSNGNVGIGTTTPQWNLQIAGTKPSFALSDTSAGDNLKHWLFSSMGGNLYIGTSTDAYATSTPAALTILNNGNLGIGANSPAYKLDINGTLRATGISYFDSNIYLGDATTSDITYFNSRIGDHLVPTVDNAADIGDGANWLRWRTGYFGTSVGIGGTATSTGADLLASGAYLIDAKSTLSINTTNNQPVTFGSGNVIMPYASSTALTVSGLASTTDMYVSGNQYLSQMTSGSILFAGANGLISQNNGNFNWNNTANLLTVLGNASTTQLTATGSAYLATAGGNVGIGTTSPRNLATGGTQKILDVDGGTAMGVLTLHGYSGTNPLGELSLAASSNGFYIDTTGAATAANNALIFRTTNTNSSNSVTESMRITSTGNVGIGTTSPNNKLDIYSTTKSAIGFSGASGDTYKWTIGMDVSNGGRFSIASSTALGTTDRFVIDGNGNVGIGTTSPLVTLSVQGTAGQNIFDVASSAGQSLLTVNNTGQCVTGDTLLPVIAGSDPQSRISGSRVKPGMTKEVRIDAIKGGEMVLSLNEKTGKLVPAKIKGLLDMGVKPIYKITTEDGKTIRTTANHPYLVKSQSLVPDVFSGADFNNSDQIFSFDNVKNSNIVKSDMKTVASSVATEFFDSLMFKGMSQFSKFKEFLLNSILNNSGQAQDLLLNFFVNDKLKHKNYASANLDCLRLLKNSSPSTQPSLASASAMAESYLACALGDSSSLTHSLNSFFSISKLDTNCFKASTNSLVLGSKTPTTDLSLINNGFDNGSECINLNYNELSDNNYSNSNNDLSNSTWVKVKDISVGDEIAVADTAPFNTRPYRAGTFGREGGEGDLTTDINPVKSSEAGSPAAKFNGVKFVRIAKIELLPAEQVYDIEVEGTHNFVGNGIIAHNTYISGNVGIGTAGPLATLHVAGANQALGGGYNTQANLFVASTDAEAINKGGSISLGGLMDTGATSYTYARIHGKKETTGVGSALGYLAFETDNNNNLVEAMRIDSSQRVGIGTTSPNNKLDIYSATKSAIGFSGASGDTYKWTIGMDVSNGGRFSIASSTALGTTDRFVIDGNGNVGIGTTSPSYKLSVAGSGYFDSNLTATNMIATSSILLNGTPLDAAMDSNTVLMLHMNGTDGGAIFVDSSASGHQITANGNATTTDDKTKFGATVAGFDGTGDYLSVPNSTDWTFGTDDFTIDMWIYHTSISGQQTYISDSYGDSAGVYLFKTAGNALALYYSSVIASGGTINANTWYHIAVTRAGTNTRLFINGIEVASVVDGTNLTDNAFFVADSFPSSNAMIGYIDEVRVSKGIARWASSFTPPSRPYANSSAFVINSSGQAIYNGNVGIGTTSPLVTLSVQGTAGQNIFDVASSTGQSLLTVNNTGQCVTGDTKLRRRRRKKKGSADDDDEEYEWEDVEIKDIMPGDEILTMDEVTGKLVVSRVNALMDMGVKPIYKITTARRKTIRTTENHPYYVETKAAIKQQKFFRFEIDQSIRIEELAEDTILALANGENNYAVIISTKTKRRLFEIYRREGKKKQFAPAVFAASIVSAIYVSRLEAREIVVDIEYPGYEKTIIEFIKFFFPEMNIYFTAIGKKSKAHYAAYGVYIKKRIADGRLSYDEISNLIQTKKTLRTVTPLDKSQTIRSPHDLLGNALRHSIYKDSIARKFVKHGNWTKVKYLKIGQNIAVSDEKSGRSIWDKIIKIEYLPEERVYDIEVEGTHNFVANGIIAHNTYISGNVGIGTSSPFGLLSVEQGTETASLWIGNTGSSTPSLMVSGVNGNGSVGIGTTDFSLGVGNTYDKYLSVFGASNASLQLGAVTTAGNQRVGAIQFLSQVNYWQVAGIYGETDTTQSTGRLIFATNDGAVGLAEKMRIDKNGNVGIGTTTPTSLLQVSGALPKFYLSDTAGALDNKHWFMENSAGVLSFGTTTDALSVSGTRALSITNAGNVGIGTTTPWGLLSVNANGIASGAPQFVVGSSTATNFIVANGGNVGIGTQSPGSKLEVSSDNPVLTVTDTVASGIGSTATIKLSTGGAYGSTANPKNMDISFDGYGSENAKIRSYNAALNSDTGGLGFFTATTYNAAATEKVRILPNGNVGIGTTTPASLLNIANATAPKITLSDTDASENQKHWFIESDTGSFNIGTTSDVLATNATYRALTINTSGNVGIGTTTPSNVLTVYNSSAAIAGFSGGAASGVWSMGYDVTNNRFAIASSSSITSNVRMVIDNSGNVGIGTTNPNAKLDVQGLISGQYINATSTTATSTFSGGFAAGNNAGLTVNYAAPAGSLYINPAGNVGIGTANPGTRLDVKSASAGSNFAYFRASDNEIISYFTDDASGNGSFTVRDTSGNVDVVLNTAGDSYFNGGNVGIGTTSPDALLDVNGNVYIENQGQLRFGVLRANGAQYASLSASSTMAASVSWTLPNADGTLGQVLTTNAAGNMYWSSASIPAGTDGQTLSYVGTTLTATSTITVLANGNVGIGTTSPYSILSISNSASTAVNTPLFTIASTTAGTATSTLLTVLASGNVGVGTASPDYRLTVSDSSLVRTRIGLTNTSANNSLNLTAFGSTGGGIYWSGFDSANIAAIDAGGVLAIMAGTGLVFSGNSDGEAMRINASNNIGIGTTSPSAKLHIYGGTDNNYGELKIESSDSGNAGLSFLAKTGTAANRNWSIQNNYNVTGNLEFLVSTADGGAPATSVMSMLSSGYVGIGVLSPTGLLTVYNSSDSDNAVFKIGKSTAADFSIWRNNTTGALSFQGTQGGANNIVLAPTSGYVGIGAAATAPTHLIELDSDTYGTTAGWTDGSDRNRKENFTILDNVSLASVATSTWTGNGSTIDAIEYGAGGNVNLTNNELLSRLSLMPITQYNFIDDGDTNQMASSTIKHIGPTAQDFYKLFGLGAADTRIKATDMAGVALAGIKALSGRLTPLYQGINIASGLATSTSFMSVSELGNIGIGTSTPAADSGIKLAVGGDIAATGFVNLSTREAKRDIEYLSSADYESVLAKISGIRVATYYYNDDKTYGTNGTYGSNGTYGTYGSNDLTGGKRLGLIAEEAPREVLSADGKGVDLYKLASFTLMGVKELNKKVDSFELKVKSLAVSNLNLDPKITKIAQEEAGKLDAALTVRLDGVNNTIINQFSMINDKISQLNAQRASTTALSENIKIDGSGNLVIGKTPLTPLDKGGEIQIIDITKITASSTQAAFVVNQIGSGQVADFQNNGVSVMNIASDGQVKIVGSLFVDGRIMLCTGGQCSNALDSATDATMADLGVEGKVVAGAFEGYCDTGYVWVSGSAKYGTLPGFCVMNDLVGKDETKIPPTPFVKGGEDVAWSNISQGEAQYACQSLGAGYHLLGESEWLTLAENILTVAANDADAVAAGMQLATSTGYKLTNDNIINNLSGGMAEWTNQNVTTAGMPVTPTADNWHEYSEVSDYKGLNVAPDYYLTNANNYIGKIYTGTGSGPRGFVRGAGGIYGLDLSHSPAEQSASIGFRCAK